MRKTALLLAASAAAAMAASALSQPAPEPAPVIVDPDAPIAAAEVRAAAVELAALLEESYVFPDVARLYAEALRANVGRGAYDALGTIGAAAERLTADLLAVSPDNHLRVMVAPPGEPGAGPRRVMVRSGGQAGAAPPRPMMPTEPVEAARWLAPGIAFVRFNLFPGSAESVAAAERFMRDHADAQTIIFDIRTHRGGGLAEMNALLPYLFARPTTLLAMDTRASVDRSGRTPIADGPTLVRVPTDEDVVRREHRISSHASESRLFDARVFVLTSNFTGSAAEHFALALKRTGRATLVGEATGGAGHYGGVRPFGGRFAVFVPVGRTFDPDTGRGWEGDGVAPDIAVPAERALVEALVRSGVAPAEAERLSAQVHPSGPMQRSRRG